MDDLTIRTALLEARFVWGDRPLYDQAAARFKKEIVAGNARSRMSLSTSRRSFSRRSCSSAFMIAAWPG